MQGTVVALTGPRTLELRQYDVPDPGPGEVLLRVRRANVCGSDIHAFHWESPALRGAVLGHEFVGEVAALGNGVATDFAGAPVAIGDRVVSVYFVTCRRCPACQRGEFNMCHNSMSRWARSPDLAPHFTGAFGTHYMLSPDHYFFRVPGTLSDAHVAGANCGLAQVVFTLDRIGLRRDETIVVQGAGGLGMYAGAYAHAIGARVVVIDGVPERLALARRFGADEIVDMRELPSREDRVAAVQALTAGAGADVVLELAGVAAAFPEGIDLLRIGGRMVSMGNLNVGPANAVPVEPGLITRKQATITGILRYDPWYLHKALQFLEETASTYPYGELSSREFSLSEIEEAIHGMESHSIARPALVLT